MRDPQAQPTGTRMTRLSLTMTSLTVALALAACQSEAPSTDAGNGDLGLTNEAMPANDATKAPQQFAFTGGDGAPLGSVTVTEDAAGLMLAISATGMPAGKRAVRRAQIRERRRALEPECETAWPRQSGGRAFGRPAQSGSRRGRQRAHHRADPWRDDGQRSDDAGRRRRHRIGGSCEGRRL